MPLLKSEGARIKRDALISALNSLDSPPTSEGPGVVAICQESLRRYKELYGHLSNALKDLNIEGSLSDEASPGEGSTDPLPFLPAVGRNLVSPSDLEAPLMHEATLPRARWALYTKIIGDDMIRQANVQPLALTALNYLASYPTLISEVTKFELYLRSLNVDATIKPHQLSRAVAIMAIDLYIKEVAHSYPSSSRDPEEQQIIVYLSKLRGLLVSDFPGVSSPQGPSDDTRVFPARSILAYLKTGDRVTGELDPVAPLVRHLGSIGSTELGLNLSHTLHRVIIRDKYGGDRRYSCLADNWVCELRRFGSDLDQTFPSSPSETLIRYANSYVSDKLYTYLSTISATEAPTKEDYRFILELISFNSTIKGIWQRGLGDLDSPLKSLIAPSSYTIRQLAKSLQGDLRSNVIFMGQAAPELSWPTARIIIPGAHPGGLFIPLLMAIAHTPASLFDTARPRGGSALEIAPYCPYPYHAISIFGRLPRHDELVRMLRSLQDHIHYPEVRPGPLTKYERLALRNFSLIAIQFTVRKSLDLMVKQLEEEPTPLTRSIKAHLEGQPFNPLLFDETRGRQNYSDHQSQLIPPRLDRLLSKIKASNTDEGRDSTQRIRLDNAQSRVYQLTNPDPDNLRPPHPTAPESLEETLLAWRPFRGTIPSWTSTSPSWGSLALRPLPGRTHTEHPTSLLIHMRLLSPQCHPRSEYFCRNPVPYSRMAIVSTTGDDALLLLQASKLVRSGITSPLAQLELRGSRDDLSYSAGLAEIMSSLELYTPGRIDELGDWAIANLDSDTESVREACYILLARFHLDLVSRIPIPGALNSLSSSDRSCGRVSTNNGPFFDSFRPTLTFKLRGQTNLFPVEPGLKGRGLPLLPYTRDIVPYLQALQKWLAAHPSSSTVKLTPSWQTIVSDPIKRTIICQRLHKLESSIATLCDWRLDSTVVDDATLKSVKAIFYKTRSLLFDLGPPFIEVEKVMLATPEFPSGVISLPLINYRPRSDDNTTRADNLCVIAGYIFMAGRYLATTPRHKILQQVDNGADPLNLALNRIKERNKDISDPLVARLSQFTNTLYSELKTSETSPPLTKFSFSRLDVGMPMAAAGPGARFRTWSNSNVFKSRLEMLSDGFFPTNIHALRAVMAYQSPHTKPGLLKLYDFIFSRAGIFEKLLSALERKSSILQPVDSFMPSLIRAQCVLDGTVPQLTRAFKSICRQPGLDWLEEYAEGVILEDWSALAYVSSLAYLSNRDSASDSSLPPLSEWDSYYRLSNFLRDNASETTDRIGKGTSFDYDCRLALGTLALMLYSNSYLTDQNTRNEWIFYHSHLFSSRQFVIYGETLGTIIADVKDIMDKSDARTLMNLLLSTTRERARSFSSSALDHCPRSSSYALSLYPEGTTAPLLEPQTGLANSLIANHVNQLRNIGLTYGLVINKGTESEMLTNYPRTTREIGYLPGYLSGTPFLVDTLDKKGAIRTASGLYACSQAIKDLPEGLLNIHVKPRTTLPGYWVFARTSHDPVQLVWLNYDAISPSAFSSESTASWQGLKVGPNIVIPLIQGKVPFLNANGHPTPFFLITPLAQFPQSISEPGFLEHAHLRIWGAKLSDSIRDLTTLISKTMSSPESSTSPFLQLIKITSKLNTFKIDSEVHIDEQGNRILTLTKTARETNDIPLTLFDFNSVGNPILVLPTSRVPSCQDNHSDFSGLILGTPSVVGDANSKLDFTISNFKFETGCWPRRILTNLVYPKGTLALYASHLVPARKRLLDLPLATDEELNAFLDEARNIRPLLDRTFGACYHPSLPPRSRELVELYARASSNLQNYLSELATYHTTLDSSEEPSEALLLSLTCLINSHSDNPSTNPSSSSSSTKSSCLALLKRLILRADDLRVQAHYQHTALAEILNLQGALLGCLYRGTKPVDHPDLLIRTIDHGMAYNQFKQLDNKYRQTCRTDVIPLNKPLIILSNEDRNLYVEALECIKRHRSSSNLQSDSGLTLVEHIKEELGYVQARISREMLDYAKERMGDAQSAPCIFNYNAYYPSLQAMLEKSKGYSSESSDRVLCDRLSTALESFYNADRVRALSIEWLEIGEHDIEERAASDPGFRDAYQQLDRATDQRLLHYLTLFSTPGLVRSPTPGSEGYGATVDYAALLMESFITKNLITIAGETRPFAAAPHRYALHSLLITSRVMMDRWARTGQDTNKFGRLNRLVNHVNSLEREGPPSSDSLLISSSKLHAKILDSGDNYHEQSLYLGDLVEKAAADAKTIDSIMRSTSGWNNQYAPAYPVQHPHLHTLADAANTLNANSRKSLISFHNLNIGIISIAAIYTVFLLIQIYF